MKNVAFAAFLLLAFADVGRAVTLELSFDQPTFNTTTTGSFRLYGSFGIGGLGSSSVGDEVTSYIFDGSFRGTSTATPSNDFYLWMDSYSATGTVEYGGSTYPILSDGQRTMWLSFSEAYGKARPHFQVFVAPTPTGAGSSGGPIVDMTGTFTASKSGGAGMTFADMFGDYDPHEYDPGGPAFTIAAASPVPEPGTAAMAFAALACGGWHLFRRRRA